MGTILIIIGSLACLVGIFLLLTGMRPASRYWLIKRSPLITLAALSEKPANRRGFRVAVSGIVESERELIAPGSKTPCVYFRHQVDRRLELKKFTDMADSYLEPTWDRLHDWSVSVPFRLVENHATVQVNPRGASFIAKQVLLEDESAPGYGPSKWSPEEEPSSRTPYEFRKVSEVHRVTEWVIPTEHRVCLFGIARKEGGTLVFSGDPGPLIISHFPRDETLSEFQKGFVMLILGLITAFAGLLMSLVAVLL